MAYAQDLGSCGVKPVEVQVLSRPQMLKKLKNIFPAFRHKNYRLYFAGQLISMTGTWLQMITQGWLVYNLTKSAFWVGAVGAVGTLPLLIFTPYAGVLVDRFSKRKILILTQIASFVFAFALAILTILNIANVWHVAVLAFFLTLAAALDVPARQSFLIELVGKRDLSSAVALQAGIFNTARIIGPALAGLLIVYIGIGGTFLLNALSFVPLTIAFIKMRVKPLHFREHAHPLRALTDGVRYAFTHPTIGFLLVYTAIFSVFGWSYATIMPVITQSVFGQSADVLGYLFVASGVGAIIATFFVSAYSNTISGKVMIIGGGLLFGTALVAFSFVRNFIYAFPILFFSGVGMVGSFATVLSMIQHKVDHAYRGRVSALHILAFAGMFPVGNFLIGWLAEQLGPMSAVRTVGAVLVIASLPFFFKRKGFD